MEGNKAMSSGGEFRTVLFGGYNKDDVHEYVQELERNAEMAKNEYQREIIGLKTKLQKAQEESSNSGTVAVSEGADEAMLSLRAEYERCSQDLETSRQENEDLRQKISELETENLELSEKQARLETESGSAVSAEVNEEEYREKLEVKEKENEKLKQEIESLMSANILHAEEKQSMESELEELRNAAAIVEDSSSLQEEIQKMRQEKEKYESDCKAISQVLEDARAGAQNIREEAKKKADGILSEAEKKAGNIIEEAQKKAEGILERAKKEREKIFDEWKGQIDKDLENKGIRLMAAKYKIDACREEVNLAQQKLFSLYTDMGKLVEGMPKRLEQLWDNDTRFASHAASAEEDDSTVDDEDKA